MDEYHSYISAIGLARFVVFFVGIFGAHTVFEIFSKGRRKFLHDMYSLAFMGGFAACFFYSV